MVGQSELAKAKDEAAKAKKEAAKAKLDAKSSKEDDKTKAKAEAKTAARITTLERDKRAPYQRGQGEDERRGQAARSSRDPGA
jgi:hypothetical protein